MKKISVFIFLIAFILSVAWLFLANNIHVVIPHQVYRSAQLTPGSLAYLIQREGIKTVINLRGANQKEWYDNEVVVTQKLGVKQYDLPMSAYRVTSAQNLSQLVNLLETAPRPILVHCEGGSDRTGLASALVLILDENKSLKEAKQQFSLYYLVIHANSTGKISLPHYEKWLREKHLQSSRENLLEWIKQLQPGINYPL
ncbi:MAG: tyrosine protein phosphatase [Gammaproteobacteria bacterium]|jgi:undecaprenyl-diphosphatase|nr:tyrosine protein phosphatase [Gammaproteobacteria bacterium]